MNKGLPAKLQEKFPYIKGKEIPVVVTPENLNPYWVAGFMDAEGCFFVKSKVGLGSSGTITRGYWH